MTATTFDQALADQILDAFAEGLSLTEACELANVPRRTFRTWMAKNGEFKAALEAARTAGTWFLEDRYERLLKEGQAIIADAAKQGINENAAANVWRTELQGLQWSLTKRDPGRYSDRLAQQVELTGRGGKDLIPPHEQSKDRTQLALALLNIIRGSDDPGRLPEPSPAPEPRALPRIILHEPDDQRVIEHVPSTPEPVRETAAMFRERVRRHNMFREGLPPLSEVY